MIHTFPVPRHMTVEEAWFEYSHFGRLVEYRWWKPRFWRPRWVTISVDPD